MAEPQGHIREKLNATNATIQKKTQRRKGAEFRIFFASLRLCVFASLRFLPIPVHPEGIPGLDSGLQNREVS